jgi:hypothetical protein
MTFFFTSSRQRCGARRSMPRKYWSYFAFSASISSSSACASPSSSSFSRFARARASSVGGFRKAGFAAPGFGGGFGGSAPRGV